MINKLSLKLVLIVATATVPFACAAPKDQETARWEQEARNVTIIRDDWGIAHVYGKTDADAVFGMIYAQAEDDFNRVETNYINAMGRLAETEGESKIYLDLRMKLFIDPVALQAQYAASPAWLKTLMNSFADGLNFYLHKHPEVKPRVITPCFSSTPTPPSSSAPSCKCSATRGWTPTAPSPGDSSSSTRASTNTPAGCTPQAASMQSMSISKRWRKRATASATSTEARSAPSFQGRSPSPTKPPAA